MADTVILATKDEEQAKTFIQNHKAAGDNVVVIGKTDRVKLYKENDAGITWSSGASADWFVVLATPDKITTPEKQN